MKNHFIMEMTGVLNRLKRYLPCAILKTIYVSLVQSKMNYALLAWGYNCGRLKKLQKKAIRIITNSKYLHHTTPLFKKLNLLKLEDMFKVNMLKWYYRHHNKQLPSYFLNFKKVWAIFSCWMCGFCFSSEFFNCFNW